MNFRWSDCLCWGNIKTIARNRAEGLIHVSGFLNYYFSICQRYQWKAQHQSMRSLNENRSTVGLVRPRVCESSTTSPVTASKKCSGQEHKRQTLSCMLLQQCISLVFSEPRTASLSLQFVASHRFNLIKNHLLKSISFLVLHCNFWQ